MLKKTMAFLLFFVCSIQVNASKIKAICIDINVLLETNLLHAMKYVNTWDAAKYTFKVKHKPSQADLFQKLEQAPASSTIITYNDELKMPLILSDWLINNQSTTILKTTILEFLRNAKISDTEKKVLSDVVIMMLTPSSLVDTQKIISSHVSIISQLKTNGYKIYIVGNWADTPSLKQEFKQLFNHAHDSIFSGDIHKIKPEEDFYQTVLNKINVDKDSCLWIEKESQFIKAAKQYGLHVINGSKHLDKELKSFGIIY